MDTTTTLQPVSTWPVEDQLALVLDLWDQIIDSGWRPSPSEELKAELSRSLAGWRPTRLTRAGR